MHIRVGAIQRVSQNCTIDHTIFGFPTSQEIRMQINSLLTALISPTHVISVTMLQVFMTDPLHRLILKLLWCILPKISCFCIWKAWNDHYIPLPPTLWNRRAIIAQIWHRFRIYVQKEWHLLLTKGKRRGETHNWVRYDYSRVRDRLKQSGLQDYTPKQLFYLALCFIDS